MTTLSSVTGPWCSHLVEPVYKFRKVFDLFVGVIADSIIFFARSRRILGGRIYWGLNANQPEDRLFCIFQ